MNNSTIARKTRMQLDDFMVKMFHGFPKPQNKFIRDMVYSYKSRWQVVEGYLTRWPQGSSGHSCAMEAGRRKPWSRRRMTTSQRCRDGTSCRTSASDSQRSSEEAGSPASEEARGCKRRRVLRTQPAVLSRQGRLNEVRCLE